MMKASESQPAASKVTASASTSTFSIKPRKLHRVYKRSFLRTSLLVFSISLTLAYLVWGCFRHLSLASRKDDTIRALATGGSSKDDECFEAKSSSAGETESGQGEADLGASGGHAQEWQEGPLSSEHQGRSEDEERADGWGNRRMPADWAARTRSTLAGWKSISTACLRLLNILPPAQSVTLVSNMTSLVAVELSGFGYIPHEMQRLRWEAGTAFIAVIERVFFGGVLRKAMVDSNLGNRLRKTRALIRKVIRNPPEDELMSQRKAKAKLTRHWRLSTDALQCVQHHLGLLLPGEQQAFSPAQAEMVLNVIQAVVDVRKAQMLADSMLRRWLGICHKEARAGLYTREDFEAGNVTPDLGEEEQRAELAAAVARAGGQIQVEMPGTSTHAQPRASTSRDTETPPHPGDSGGPQGEQVPPSSEGASSAGPVALETDESVLFKKHAAGFLEALQLSTAIEQRQAQEESGSDEERQDTQEQRLLQIASAEALGWGPGRMPLAATTQLNILTMRLQKAGNCCLWLINVVSAELAVRVALNVTKLVAVESAGLAFAPPEIQTGRRGVQKVFNLLLRTLGEREGLQEAAGRLGLRESIDPLRRFLEEVSGVPTTGPWDTEQYLVFMVSSWRQCNFSTQQTLRLLNGLIPTRHKRVRPHHVHQAVATVDALYHVRKKQLLSEPRVSQWLDTCQTRVSPDLLFTQRELEEAEQSRKKSAVSYLEEISKTIQEATHSSPSSGTSEQQPSRPAQASAPSARTGARRKVSEEPQQRARPCATSQRPSLSASQRGRRSTAPPSPSRQQHEPSQAPSSAALPSRTHAGAGILGEAPAPGFLSEVARVVRRVTSPSWPSQTSRRPPASAAAVAAAAAGAVYPLLPAERQTWRPQRSETPSWPSRVFMVPQQPPTARPSRPQLVIDPLGRYPQQTTQRYPSAPPSPAPVVQLPELYYQRFPQMYQTYDFRARAASARPSPSVSPSPIMRPHPAYSPLPLHPPQSPYMPTWSMGPARASPEDVWQSSGQARGPMGHQHLSSFMGEFSAQPEGAAGGYDVTALSEQFASWSTFPEEDQPDE
ncbi:hypothetical protein Emed_006660 [Eimeria media]